MRSIGVDLGGTKLLGVSMDGTEILDQQKVPTPAADGPEVVLGAIVDLVASLDPDGRAETIGVGVPGPVDPASGVVAEAPNLAGWDAVPVRDRLERALSRPVTVDNDVNVATFGEQQLGAARGTADVLGLFVGTGVGAGVVLDDRLRRGPRGLAGEIGHLLVDLPTAGREPVEVETLAGRRSLEIEARRRAAEGTSTLLVELAGDAPMKSRTWAKAVAQGDPVALELVSGAVDALAAAIVNVVLTVDIEVVVIGGGLAERLGPEFRDRIETRVTEWCFGNGTARLVPAELGDHSGAVGAALLSRVAD